MQLQGIGLAGAKGGLELEAFCGREGAAEGGEWEPAAEIPSAAKDLDRKTWCERGDSNPHGFPRQILSLVRLPIPPLSHRG